MVITMSSGGLVLLVDYELSSVTNDHQLSISFWQVVVVVKEAKEGGQHTDSAADRDQGNLLGFRGTGAAGTCVFVYL
jgi:hypothetical protein